VTSSTSGDLAVITQSVAPVLAPETGEEQTPAAPTGFDLAAELFSDDVVPEFDVELSDAAMDDLRSSPYEWVEGALVYQGARFEPVGVRLKGENSFLPIDEKPSIKVKLDLFVDGLDLLGLEELTFDNMSGDRSMMHERVSYRLFRESGLAASRANHAAVRINGEDRGLYTLVENVDEELLELWYPDPTGSLWELHDVDFVDADVASFEAEHGSDDRAPLQAIADAIETFPPLAYAAAEPWVDWDQFVRFVGAAVVVGQFDSYPWRTPGDDVHLYFDPADGRMDLLPHGMDETFSHGHSAFDAGGLLFAACMANPGCADDYVDAVWDAQDVAEAMDLLGYAETVRDQIRPLAEADPARPYTMAEVEDEQDTMLAFIDDRADDLANDLGGR
jgi:spore coat protein CotH